MVFYKAGDPGNRGVFLCIAELFVTLSPHLNASENIYNLSI